MEQVRCKGWDSDYVKSPLQWYNVKERQDDNNSERPDFGRGIRDQVHDTAPGPRPCIPKPEQVVEQVQ